MKYLFKRTLVVLGAFLLVFAFGGNIGSDFSVNTDINKAHAESNTESMEELHGPYYFNKKGSKLTTKTAKYSPASKNQSAAARKAVLDKYGEINKDKTYRIKWYQKITYNNGFGGSYKGSIVKVSVTN